MKRIITFCTISVLALSLASCSKKDTAQTTPDPAAKATTANDVAAPASAAAGTASVQKYKTKSAIVHYTNSAMGMNMDMTTYIDNYGAIEAQETTSEMKMMGQVIKTNQLRFMKDGYLYDINLEKKTGTRRKGGVISAGVDYSQLTSADKSMMERYHVKKEGTQNIAGKDCDVYSMDDGKGMKGSVASWQGIPMSVDMTVSGMKVVQKANKLEIDVPIPAEKFEVPAGVTIKDI